MSWKSLYTPLAKVGKTCDIVFHKNYYSVPYAYGDKEIVLAAGKNLTTLSNKNHEQ